MKTLCYMTAASLLAISSSIWAQDCDDDSAYAADLGATSGNIPNIEKHAPYQLVEHETHWTFSGYDDPGAIPITPIAKIDTTSCTATELHFG
ncbi:MAG: hypothetical protein COB94_005425 [Gammaproteobacteria bacterium]|nr:hypothetical protein [Gammaproteobacteria bacterium]